MRRIASLIVLAAALPAFAAGPQPELVTVVKARDAAAVRALIARKADVNATETDGTSA